MGIDGPGDAVDGESVGIDGPGGSSGWSEGRCECGHRRPGGAVDGARGGASVGIDGLGGCGGWSKGVWA